MKNDHNKIFLSVIIPSYNEAKNFQRGCLKDLLPFLEQQGYAYEVIFSDDGSTDETVKLLSDYRDAWQSRLQNGELIVLKNQHGGKAATVCAGMKQARGAWRLFTDFDQSTPISEVRKLLKYQDSFDIIFGSRKIDTKSVHAKWYRKFIGDTFNLITRSLTGLKIRDTQCGFKLFNEKASVIFNQLYVYNPERTNEAGAFTGAFDVELFVIAKQLGLKAKEVPIRWQHFATDRVNIVKDSWRMFKDILKIRKAKLQGRYQGSKDQCSKD